MEKNPPARDRCYCRFPTPARDPVDQIAAGYYTNPGDRDRLGEWRGSASREAGIPYLLDPEKVMFSMGNREEKTRIAGGQERRADCRHVCRDRVFFHAARGCGADVHAMEINPVAFGYLVRSMRANRFPAALRLHSGTAGGSLTAPMTGSSWGISMQSPCSLCT